MIRIINGASEIGDLYGENGFVLDRWKDYADNLYPGLSALCLDDMNETISATDLTFQNNYLPVIDAVRGNAYFNTLISNFEKATDGLDPAVREKFGAEVDCDVILYLGLCSGAGWVTDIGGKSVILLGIEKILELGWYSQNDMYALVLHELGHVFQKQHGVLERTSKDNSENFVWQLFTEGIAMCFEQTVLDDDEFYHQNINGWKNWCEEHLSDIVSDFDADLPEMTQANQRFFGDWVSYHGRGDVGYFLGTVFVRSLIPKYGFINLLSLEINRVYAEYRAFADTYIGK